MREEDAMHAMTAAHLRSGHAGESMAHMRYRIWAEGAEAENAHAELCGKAKPGRWPGPEE